ncbi:MAG TPA: YhjD/YihY/BrkB family envelope integrity protein [Phycisphaeraceae bacterium]
MLSSLRRLMDQSTDELTQLQRWVRYFVELTHYCWRQLLEDRAEEMAAALTYRTIFGLIPLLVLGLVMFRAFGGFQEVQEKIQPALFRLFGVPEVTYVEQGAPQEETPPPEAQPPPPEAQSSDMPQGNAALQQSQADARVRANIRQTLVDLSDKVSRINFTSIGVAGVLLFIYAALALAIAVEQDFNIIVKSPRGRPWHLRIPIYWSMITLGIGLLALSLYLSSQIVNWARQFEVFGPVIGVLGAAMAFLSSWTLLFLIYLLIPNAAVKPRPALIGSFVAAALWELGKLGFQVYVRRALPYSALYGSLGLIPLFLFWIYISWLVTLFGLELTYALQTVRSRRQLEETTRQEAQEVADARWLIPLMAVVTQRFAQGQASSVSELSRQTALPLRIVHQLSQCLQGEGLLHSLESASDGEPRYTLAMPPEQIPLRRLIEVGQTLAAGKHATGRMPAQDVLDRLDAAVHQAASELTLAHLMNASDKETTK